MKYRYLFNSSGHFVAYIYGGNIFTNKNQWFGYLKNGNEVYAKSGQFVGYLLDDDRVVRNKKELPRMPQPLILPPLTPLPPLPPLSRLPMTYLPYPYEDVFKTD